MRALNLRPEGILVLLLLAASPFLLTCWVHGDGIGYVAMLRSMAVDHDLALGDEFDYLPRHILDDARGWPAALLSRSARAPGVDPTFQRARPDPVTGRVAAIYSVGPPLAWAPAYLIAHQITRARGGDATGYGGLYYLAIALSSLGLGTAGLLLSFRIARAVAPGGDALWAALAVAFASPLLYYLYLAPSYGHALTVFTSSAFLLHWWRTRGSRRTGTWFVRGMLAGLLFLARWSDVVLALPVLVIEGARLMREPGAGRSLVLGLAAALVGALLIASPQLALWQYFHGRPWVRHPAGYAGLVPEGLLGTLFSSRHGLFVWTPVTLLSVIGLIRLGRRDRELAGVALAGLVLLIVANSMVRDWWGGSSFGMRRMIGATPLMVLGLAVLLEDTRLALSGKVPERSQARPARVAGAALPALLTLLVLWNGLLLVQYGLGMISHDGPVTLSRIALNQPRAAERLLSLAHGIRP